MLRRDRLRKALTALGHARKTPASRTRPVGPPADLAPALVKILQGSWEETDLGPVFVRERRFALGHRHGNLPLDAPLGATSETLSWMAGGESVPPPRSFAFVDMETTGLSGGTGTYAFLACVGSFEPEAFLIRQYFLFSPGAEPAMLHLLARDLGKFEGIVSYNGRAFDLPLLQTRMTLARLPDPCKGRPHIDLLHSVRRLYRQRMESCRLAEAENHVLGFHREGDVPGHLVPSLYFDYLRAGRIGPLRGVFRHNEEDVLSLGGLLAHITSLLSRPDPDPRDAVALGRWWELEGKPERAESYYRMAVDGLTPGSDWRRAAWSYSLIRKRAGARAEVVGLWETLWSGGDREAGVEIAKYLEHEARDLKAAEGVTRALLARATTDDRPRLEHRLARLQRRRQARLK